MFAFTIYALNVLNKKTATDKWINNRECTCGCNEKKTANRNCRNKRIVKISFIFIKNIEHMINIHVAYVLLAIKGKLKVFHVQICAFLDILYNFFKETQDLSANDKYVS